MLIIEKSRYFMAPMPHRRLKEYAKRSQFDFLYLGSHPHNIAIMIKKSIIENYDEETIRQVLIKSEKDAPLWKQHMDISMGYKPRKVERLEPLGVYPLGDRKKISHFEVYEISR